MPEYAQVQAYTVCTEETFQEKLLQYRRIIDKLGSLDEKGEQWLAELQWSDEGLAFAGTEYPLISLAYISINWRAKPLTSLDVVLELILHTTKSPGDLPTLLRSNAHAFTPVPVWSAGASLDGTSFPFPSKISE